MGRVASEWSRSRECQVNMSWEWCLWKYIWSRVRIIDDMMI